MQKLYTILGILDVYALNRLRKWLCSPAHNEQASLVALFDACREVVKKGKGDWKLVKSDFPKGGSVKNDAHEYSKLVDRIEDWLAYEEQSRNQVQQILATATEYSGYGLESYADEERGYAQTLHNKLSLPQGEKKAEKSVPRNAEWHYWQFRLAESREHKNVKNVRQTRKTELQTVSNQLDVFYIVKRLSYYINGLTYKNVLQIDINTDGLPELLAYIKALDLLAEPLITIYYYSVMVLLETESDEYIEKLIGTLNVHYQLLTNAEAYEHYTVTVNYSIRQINQGKSEYFNKLFDLYKTLLEKNVLLEDGILREWDYKNIVTVGLRVQAFDWVEQFIQVYSEKLPLDLRENALTYNLAKLYFAKADYKKVIEQLRDVQYIDVVYNLDSRATLLKTYFELGEFDALESFLESFRIYLLRNKTIATIVKKQYENLIRFTKKIMILRQNDKKTIPLLILKIENTPQIADKKWLLQKLETKN